MISQEEDERLGRGIMGKQLQWAFELVVQRLHRLTKSQTILDNISIR